MKHCISNNKVALVTGGGRRIGATICRELHRCNYNILIHHNRSKQDAERLSAELNSIRKDSCNTLSADLSNTHELEELLNRGYKFWQRLDCLINNASTFFPTPIENATEQQWFELVDVNVKAPLFLVQAAIPYLRLSQGCIINILDVHAERPLTNYSIYSASKAALASTTQSLAVELAPEIRVNGVAPGAILWPENGVFSQQSKENILESIPLQRCGDPSDIATVVRFLASEAPYITGQIISVDGGRSLTL